MLHFADQANKADVYPHYFVSTDFRSPMVGAQGGLIHTKPADNLWFHHMHFEFYIDKFFIQLPTVKTKSQYTNRNYTVVKNLEDKEN